MTARMPQRYLRWMGFIAALALLSSCSILPAETFEVYQLLLHQLRSRPHRIGCR